MAQVIGTKTTAMPLVESAERARQYLRQSKAANTLRAYRADWRHFDAWCHEHNLEALPASAESLVLYCSASAAICRVSTLERRLAGISQIHQLAGYESPTRTAAVRTLMAGIRRSLATAPRSKQPLLTSDIRNILSSLGNNPFGARDRALVLIGFAGAFRRSELTGLNREDIGFTTEGLVVTIRRSKTDPEGRGRKIGIPYGTHPETCPVGALECWLNLAAIESGPLFRRIHRGNRIAQTRLSARAVALILKRLVAAAGLEPSCYAGHSLRAGLATSAAIAGASERSIMAQTGHRSVQMVRRYIRDGSLFRENAAASAGL